MKFNSNYFMQRFILIGLLCLLFSCKETNNEGNDDLFTPSINMTQEQIINLLEKAIEATISSDKISYTFKDTTNKYPDDPTDESKIDYSYSLNKQMQKSLGFYFYHDYGTQFWFVDGYYEYYYYQLENKLQTSKLSDVYWSHYRGFNERDFELQCDKYTWTINGKCFIGKNEKSFPSYGGYYNIQEVLEIALTKDLKINEFYSYSQTGTTYYKRKCFCTYTANPIMPQGYKISDFIPIPQYEVKIIWENGDKNIFYTYYDAGLGICTFHPSMIDVALDMKYLSGQALRLFYDADYLQPVEPTIVITKNVTFYAKIVDL